MADITGYPYGKLPRNWEKDVLDSLQAPVTTGNVHFLDSWEMFEQGRDAATAAVNNPFNTTEGGAGTTTVFRKLDSTSTIWNYKDWQSGLNATIDTLVGSQAHQYHYDDIVAQLKSGKIQTGQDVKSLGFESWGGYSDVNTANYPNLPSTNFPSCTLLGQISGQCAPENTAVPTGGPASSGSTDTNTTSQPLSGLSPWIIVAIIIVVIFVILK